MYIQITPFFPSEKSFVGSYIYDQVNELKKQYEGDIKVFKTVSVLSKESDYNFEGIDVYIIKKIVLPSNILPFLFSYINFLILFSKLTKLNIDPKKLKIIHIHNLDNAIYGYYIKKKLRNIKVFIQEHGLDTFGLKMGIFKNVKWHHNYLVNRTYSYTKTSDLLIGVSKKTSNQLQRFPKFSSLKKYVLYNGVDKEKFFVKQNKGESDIFRIGCVGNFIETKNQIMLLKALMIIRKKIKCNVIFVGYGPMLEECKNFVNENQLTDEVTFIPSIKHDLLVDFYNSLDIFVLPSHYEALGCVYLESHACGTPFIGIRGQGIDEFIKNDEKDKWLVEKDNTEQLAAKIIENLKSEQALVYDYDVSVLIRNFLAKNVYN